MADIRERRDIEQLVTRFYEKVQAELKEKTNWTDSDELALMFNNNYPPAFYKQLHRYVHAHYNRVKAADHIKKVFRYPLQLQASHLKKIIKMPYYLVNEILNKRKLEGVQL